MMHAHPSSTGGAPSDDRPRLAPERLPTARASDESADLFDYALLAHYIGFTFRAVLRHKLLAAAAFLGVVAMGLGSMVFLPKTYTVSTVILALRNPMMSTLSNPGLFRPYESDAPTRAARETILRRDNLVWISEHTDLVRKWHETRAPAVRLLDEMFRLLARRDRTHEEEVDALVERLEKQLRVDVSEGTVTLTLDWPDARTGYEIVEAAMQNFLEVRRSTEISMVRDAISLLEAHAGTLQHQIDVAAREISVRERTGRRSRATVAVGRSVAPVAGPPMTQDPELQRLEVMLAAKRRSVTDLEDFRQRRVAELQLQLAQYKAIYADQHPAILSTRENIETLSGSSPQLDVLRREAQELERQIVRRTSQMPAPPVLRATPEPVRADPVPADSTSEWRLEYDRNQFRVLLNNWSIALERIDGARVEMDTAEAAFKYRYGVVSPPQLPKRARRPRPLLVIVGSLLGGLLAALLATSIRDFSSGTVVEQWQVERLMGVDVLADTTR